MCKYEYHEETQKQIHDLDFIELTALEGSRMDAILIGSSRSK